jgi:SAM-dependent methyltransferase
MNLNEIAQLRCPYCNQNEDWDGSLDFRGTNLELELMDGVLVCGSCRVAWGVQDGWVRLTREDRSPFSDKLKRGLASNTPKLHDIGLKLAGRSPCRHIDAAVRASKLDQLRGTEDSPPRILEIGVGSGGNLASIYQAAPSGAQVWGVDMSIGLLERCRRKVNNEPELAETRLLMADPHKMPFGDQSFDRVIYVGELSDFRDPEGVRAEMLRVVSPDGLVFPA